MEKSKPNKAILYRKIADSRFSKIDNSVLDILDEYSVFLEAEDLDGQSELLFYRGEAFFRLGNYEKATEILIESIHMPKSPLSAHTDCCCYNLLGLIYAFLGQESLALEHFLMSADIGIEHDFYNNTAVAYINTGWLYRDLDDYEQALNYYKKALITISHIKETKSVFNIDVVCNSYLGQLYCLHGHFDKALSILNYIEGKYAHTLNDFYDISFDDFCYHIYDYLGNKEKTDYFLQHIMTYAKSNCDFLEYFEFYYDIASHLLEYGDDSLAFQLLFYMERNCQKLSLTFTNLKFQRLKVRYCQNYSSSNEYLESCRKYMELSQQYDEDTKSSKLRGISQLQQLRNAQRQKKKYLEKSQHDPLTGLLNKYTFEFLCDNFLHKNTLLENQILSIIDLDYFKSINDNYGHLAGDQVLKDAAALLQKIIGDAHLKGRAGGDEFIVFFNDCSLENALPILQYFQYSLTQLTFEKYPSLKLTSSIGVAYRSNQFFTFEELFTCADYALYQVKTNGRNHMIIGNKEYK
ncbi:MAG: tetratricopeptide repeat-containing diguanylate cyclase [Lachnospiraceae bacterium]